VLPGGQRLYAGGHSSHRGMFGYGGNTQIYTLVAIAGHTADRKAGSWRAAQVGGSKTWVYAGMVG
jgi:uncharacterized protein YqgC (DUF456 family)